MNAALVSPGCDKLKRKGGHVHLQRCLPAPNSDSPFNYSTASAFFTLFPTDQWLLLGWKGCIFRQRNPNFSVTLALQIFRRQGRNQRQNKEGRKQLFGRDVVWGVRGVCTWNRGAEGETATPSLPKPQLAEPTPEAAWVMLWSIPLWKVSLPTLLFQISFPCWVFERFIPANALSLKLRISPWIFPVCVFLQIPVPLHHVVGLCSNRLLNCQFSPLGWYCRGRYHSQLVLVLFTDT